MIISTHRDLCYRATSMITPKFVAAAVSNVALTTVPNIELLEVGEDWETSTGTFTWSVDHLQAAIASQDDPMVRTPVIKLGHVDPRFDGQPTFGRIENLRLTNNDQTLVGDLVGVPVWLADCMPSAFPRRSIEGWFDYNTRTGNTWSFVLTGVALLGSAYPAITSLEDIALLYGETAPELVPADEIDGVAAMRLHEGTMIAVAASSPEANVIRGHRDGDTPVEARVGHTHAHTHTAGTSHSHYHSHNPGNLDHTTSTDVAHSHSHVSSTAPVNAGASVDDVRIAFYDGPGSEQGRYWWWIREVDIDPPQLIVDDDEGHLYRFSYSVDSGADGPAAVAFGDPQEVRIQYQDVPAAAVMAARFGNPVAAGRPRVRAATQPNTREGVPDVQLSDEALRALGLEPGATDEQINEAITTMTQAPQPPDPAPAPSPEPGAPSPDPAPEPTPSPSPSPTPESNAPAASDQPGSVTAPPGTVLVDATQWEETRRSAEAAAKFLHERDQERNNRVLDDAIRAGKFPVSRRDHWAQLMTADPEGTTQLIGSMASGLIPVQERGRQGGEGDPAAAAAEASAYPDEWKPLVTAASKASRSRVKVATD